MKVELLRIEARENDPGAYVLVAKAFPGWSKMGHDKWSVIQTNWTVWHGLGMWRWWRENPDEMTLHLRAKDELDAFQKFVNWKEDTSLPE